jgi:hypothetical protein
MISGFRFSRDAPAQDVGETRWLRWEAAPLCRPAESQITRTVRSPANQLDAAKLAARLAPR